MYTKKFKELNFNIYDYIHYIHTCMSYERSYMYDYDYDNDKKIDHVPSILTTRTLSPE